LRARESAVSNPTRYTRVTLPVLEPGESQTLVVRLTPRRVGDLGIAITQATTGDAPHQPLTTSRLPVKCDPAATFAQLLAARAQPTVPSHLPQKLADVPEVSLE